MQCDICKRLPSSRLPFNCELCAQAFAYPSRLALAQSLLKNEALEEEVASRIDGVSSGKKPAVKAKAAEPDPACVIGRASAEQVVATERANLASDHVLHLRSEIKQMRLDIAKRKARLQKRQKDLATSKKELTEAHSSRRETVQGEIRAIQRSWEDLHQQTIQQRVAHCTQTARLYSLQQHKRRTRAGGKDLYSIGFVPIVDLRDLNGASPVELSTTLLHLANLVHLISHHLALKLPAQIILPHSQCPYPLILTPVSSYKGRPTTKPTIKLPLALNAPHKSSAPQARPLFLEKKLSYAKSADQAIYSQAVEGMTLLAWDIAWLCKTQGLDVGLDHWEDVCAMGKNLWQLLLAPTSRLAIISRDAESSASTPARQQLLRTTTAESIPPRKERDLKDNSADAPPPPPPPPPGFFSHGTAAGYLAAEPGVAYMSDWKLQRPVNIIKKVEAMLIAEQTGAGWEILEGGEWDEEGGEQETAAALTANHQNGHAPAPTRVEETGILVKPVVVGADARRDSDREDERGKGTSGWTKLKNR